MVAMTIERAQERGTMIVLLSVLTLMLGALTATLLWPHGVVLAIIVTPFVCSAFVILIALALAARPSQAARDNAKDRATRSANPVLDALSKLLAR
ncbi:hypothetical protein [Bosea lathyri]|jgi:heme A synthase|uniref:Uncharacterized protein n=1 Tax=Bosea lathyri TaxID=1036778 RepID=A0A1H5YRP1_9HYPH|nr:hypothetical protein [Bosea lathyri]SEG26839.1 hypothetical protein SAMN04488115_10464 [Bosea lathyri]